ncbi:hypothetical protein [Thermoplasma sp. Kam2015]|nr:hypothetical protein [Thermoplasma sp. Kam2015]
MFEYTHGEFATSDPGEAITSTSEVNFAERAPDGFISGSAKK